MQPAEFDLNLHDDGNDYSIYQGDDYALHLRLKSAPTVYRDLTSVAVKSQIRDKYGAAGSLIAEFTVTQDDQTDPATVGGVTLSLTHAVATALTATQGVWDIQVTEAGKVETLLRGVVAIVPEVTRDA